MIASSNGDGGKWSDLRCVLNIEILPVTFASSLDMAYVRMEEPKITPRMAP